MMLDNFTLRPLRKSFAACGKKASGEIHLAKICEELVRLWLKICGRKINQLLNGISGEFSLRP